MTLFSTFAVAFSVLIVAVMATFVLYKLSHLIDRMASTLPGGTVRHRREPVRVRGDEGRPEEKPASDDQKRPEEEPAPGDQKRPEEKFVGEDREKTEEEERVEDSFPRVVKCAECGRNLRVRKAGLYACKCGYKFKVSGGQDG